MTMTADHVQQTAAVVAATTGMATWLAAVADLALAIFGVPLPVVLAAATGAAAARTFIPRVSFQRAVFEGLLWGAVGVFAAQLGLSGLGWLINREIPAAALSGAALMVAAGGQIFVTHELIEAVRAAIGRGINGIGRKGP